MMLFDKASGAKLRVVCQNDCVVLTPNAVNPYGDDVHLPIKPTTGSFLEGQVILTLATAKRCKKIQLDLVGKQNIAVDGIYETVETLRSNLEVDTGAQILGPGEHVFAFSFVIDATSAPYERCAYGRTYHRITATAPGMGKFNTDLKAHQNVSLVVNPSETGGLPPEFSLESETYDDTLGPVGANLSSKYLLVAGYLKLGLVLPLIAQPVQLENVQVMLYQTILLQSLKNKERQESKRMAIPLWSMRRGNQPLGTYEEGQEFSMVQQFRVKDDDFIRSTTSEHSNTGIRVSHKLAVVIHYKPLVSNPKSETKELRFSSDANFTSCCCVVEYLQLPKYTQRPSQEDLDAAFLGLCSICLCKLADSKRTLELYGIPPEDIRAAQLRVEQSQPTWKDDDEYERELQAGVSCERAMSAPPSPPAYGVEAQV